MIKNEPSKVRREIKFRPGVPRPGQADFDKAAEILSSTAKLRSLRMIPKKVVKH
jgi:hypothetical protein